MFDRREIARKALWRARQIKAQRQWKWRWLKYAALLLGAGVLAVCFAVLPAGYETEPAAWSAPALLYGEKAGGYALAEALCITLGAAVMLCCWRKGGGGGQ
ncbi:MAG: hypothetical protein LBH21_01335 [Gracilibacteraceae bacterium]|nr:hypothetical protein [Gracilibacteraceae bacterium]